MGTKELLLLLLCCASCGQVENHGHDAAVDAFVCSGSLSPCGDVCVDKMTDHDHCGSCMTMCSSAEGCALGQCLDATASCENIQILDPTAASGPYTHTTDGTQFFCDMSKASPVQYNALAMGRYNATYPGNSIIDAAQLQDPVIQQAFLFLYNKQAGFKALEAWTAANVCTTSSPAGGTRLEFGGLNLFPYANGMTANVYDTTTTYTEERSGSASTVMTPPLPMDFFTTYPPAEDTACGDGQNPALYFDKP